MQLEKIKKYASILKTINTIVIIALAICSLAFIICLLCFSAPEVTAVLAEFNVGNEVMSVLVQLIISFGVLIACFAIFNKTLTAMRMGDVFIESNSKQLEVVGILLIINALVPSLISCIVFYLAGYELSYSPELTYLFIAMGAFLLAWVLRYANTREQALQQIQQDLQARYDAEKMGSNDVFTDV